MWVSVSGNISVSNLSVQIIGLVLVGVSIGIWGYIWMNRVVYSDLPDTITDEEKVKAQIER